VKLTNKRNLIGIGICHVKIDFLL